MVRAIPVARATQKFCPLRSIAGMSKNMGRLGSTYHKVASAWSASKRESEVSRHSQIMPRIEMSGNDATSAARAGAFLPKAAMVAIISPDSRARMIKALLKAAS